MTVNDIIMSPDLEERIIYPNPLMPHSLYEVDYDHYKRDLIPWHWHDELELLYVESGRCRYRTIRKDYILCAGDAIFLKSGVLHEFDPLVPGTVSCANIFRKEFLFGESGSYLESAYLAPVLGQNAVEAVLFYHDDPAAANLLDLIRRTIALCREEPYAYELSLRNTLTDIWKYIFRYVSGHQEAPDQILTAARDARLKKMLLYISQNYAQKMTVADIASAANVSERECYRIFSNALGTSPVTFVTSYRLQQARARLRDSTDSVTDIASSVGFDSSAYFARMFRKNYGMTPHEMRKLAGSL